MNLTIRLPIVTTPSGPVLPMIEIHTTKTCACQDNDPYLCWTKRYPLDCDATSTIRSAVINDGGPCLCSCHSEDEWTDEFEGTAPC